MAQPQNASANPASEKTCATPSKFPDINANAVVQLKYATSIDEADCIMANAISEMEKKYGRPLTYSEMRGEFG